MSEKIRVFVGLLLSAAVIVYILSKVNIQNVWAAITQANMALLVLSAIVATLTFPTRALRWQAIFRPVDNELPLGAAWRATSVGFALNNALPLRLGEVARAYCLSREVPGVSFPAAFASLAVERAFDAIMLIVLLVIGLLGLPTVADSSQVNLVYSRMIAMGTIAAALVTVLVALAFFPSRIIRIYEFFARKLSPVLERRGSAILTALASGLSALRSPRRFLIVFFWSAIVWMINALAFWIGFKAFGLDASYSAALVTNGVVAFAIALPQAPSGIGVFQQAGALALGLFGIANDPAIAWGFAYWAFSFVPITTIGMIYFAQMGLSLKELKDVVSRIKGDDSASASPRTNG